MTAATRGACKYKRARCPSLCAATSGSRSRRPRGPHSFGDPLHLIWADLEAEVVPEIVAVFLEGLFAAVPDDLAHEHRAQVLAQ